MFEIRRKNGFTMIELLAVTAIVAVLVLAFMFLMRGQQAKAHDSRRKTDLENIRIAFEDYFNDNECYPPDTILDVCDSKDLDPYLKKVPCDPLSGEPYSYEPVANCAGYRVYAVLDYKEDPHIARLDCDGPEGCGAAAGPQYNYGITVGVPLYGGGVVISSPSPTPVPEFVYACDSTGVCNRFDGGNPILNTCPITFEDTNCESSCASLANRCTGV